MFAKALAECIYEAIEIPRREVEIRNLKIDPDISMQDIFRGMPIQE
jgi:hypothetical protein